LLALAHGVPAPVVHIEQNANTQVSSSSSLSWSLCSTRWTKCKYASQNATYTM